MKQFVKVIKIVGNVVLWLFVLFAVLVTILVFSAQSNKDGLSNIMGKSLVTISTDSMSPEFKRGDLIIDKVLTEVEKRSCAVGDVITFYMSDVNGDGEDDINTHRVIEVYEDAGYTYYRTKGDNNTLADENPVVYSKVLGKYTDKKIAGFGRIIDFLQTSTGFLCVIVLPLVIFFLFELYNFIAVVIKVRTKGKLSPEQEEEIKRRAVEEYLREKQEKEDEVKQDTPVE